jgi:hypothetical protein
VTSFIATAVPEQAGRCSQCGVPHCQPLPGCVITTFLIIAWIYADMFAARFMNPVNKTNITEI